VIPNENDAHELASHKKKELKAKWVFLDYMKDHLIPHRFKKNIAKDMYDYLVVLYQRGNANQKLNLRHTI
jgi:hypothetical protein